MTAGSGLVDANYSSNDHEVVARLIRRSGTIASNLGRRMHFLRKFGDGVETNEVINDNNSCK